MHVAMGDVCELMNASMCVYEDIPSCIHVITHVWFTCVRSGRGSYVSTIDISRVHV